MSSVTLQSVFAAAEADLRNVVAALEVKAEDGGRVNGGGGGDLLPTSPEFWNEFWATFEGYGAALSQACHILAITFRSGLDFCSAFANKFLLCCAVKTQQNHSQTH